jgi:hypothetical protein
MLTTMDKTTAHLKRKYPDLPDDWSVFSEEKVKGEGLDIVRVMGGISKLSRRGKNRGRPTWDGKGDRTFLMFLTEYKLIHEETETSS